MNSGDAGPVVLDCTLRDGGFYTDWDFPSDFVTAYVVAADAAGIDILELGYRSLKRSGYFGPYKYCAEWLLDSLPQLSNARLAVMLDGKELDGREDMIERLFVAAEDSRISVVRTATRVETLASVVEQVARIRDLGYETTINLMAFGNLSEDDARRALHTMADSAADALYIADSYGTMLPDSVQRLVETYREIAAKPLGLHLHNNLELAFANTLRGMSLGVRHIDSSVMGLGRGAGNLKTELLVQHLQTRLRLPGYRTEPLHEFIGEKVHALQEKYGWGPSSPYVLSGHLGVHPTYAQILIASERYTVHEVTSILETIHRSGAGGSFSQDALDAAISTRFRQVHAGAGSEGMPTLGSLGDVDWSDREVVVVGRGPSAYRHAVGINEYLTTRNPVVIECNYLPGIRPVDDHFCAFLVLANALTQAGPALDSGKKIVLGFRYAPAGPSLDARAIRERICFEPYAVRQAKLDVAQPTIPYDVVSMYGIALAVRHGARRIRLVGFDGYADSHRERDRRMQAEMQEFFGLLAERHPEIEIRSLLPTSYGLPVESLYGALFHGGEG